MNFKNISMLSNLACLQAGSTFEDKGRYVVVKTPERPQFCWGNFLIFKTSPEKNSLAEWVEYYRAEFDVDQQDFITITFDDSSQGITQPFVDYGFELETQEVLKLENLTRPGKLREDLEVRVIEREDEWNQVHQTQFLEHWPLKDPQERFIKNKVQFFQNLQKRGFGYRFGIFQGDKLLGDLGIYQIKNLGRFNNVCTLPGFHNQGICRTLVYESTRYAINHMNIKDLIMEATTTEYAKDIYKKIGFKLVGYDHQLTWLGSKWKE